MIDLSELSERERWEYLFAVLSSGKGPRAGRPKKGSDTVKWSDFGLTRKEVWRMRRLGEIPEEDFETFMEWMGANGKRSSFRSILVHFGKINVPTENDFDGTPLGDLAQSLLEPTERVLRQCNKRERRLVIRALQNRLRQIARTK